MSREHSTESAVTHVRFTLERPARQHPVQLEWPMPRAHVDYRWTFRKNWQHVNGDYHRVFRQGS